MLCYLIAQVPPVLTQPDPLGGWGAMILQGGSFVLLVYIIVVMVPREIGQQRDERNAREKSLGDTVKLMQDGFDTRADKITCAIEKQTASIVEAVNKASKETAEQVATAILKEKFHSSH